MDRRHSRNEKARWYCSLVQHAIVYQRGIYNTIINIFVRVFPNSLHMYSRSVQDKICLELPVSKRYIMEKTSQEDNFTSFEQSMCIYV